MAEFRSARSLFFLLSVTVLPFFFHMPSVAWILFHSDAKVVVLAHWLPGPSHKVSSLWSALSRYCQYFSSFFIPSIAGVLLHTTTQWLLVVVLFRWLVCGTNPFLSHIFLTNSFLSAAGHGNAEYPIASHQPLDPSTQPPNGSPPGSGGRLLAVWPIT